MNCGRMLMLAPLAALVVGSASATEIFTWIDDNGVVHYSDTKPADDKPVETLVVNRTNPPDYDPAEDPYSIANQAKRTNERWEEVEKARQERAEKREALAAAQPLRVPVYYDPYPYSRSSWYYGPTWPSRPVQPIEPPPRQLPTVRRQARALDELGLSGDRPHSINSGAHHQRVQNSNDFLSVATRPPSRPPRPQPR